MTVPIRLSILDGLGSGYEEVLSLRKRVYAEAGRISPIVSVQELRCCTDAFSYHVVAVHGGELVAGVTVAFPSRPDHVLDTERVIRGGYPKPGIPDRNDLAEVARLCIDRNFQSRELLFGLFACVYRLIGERGRGHVLTSSNAKRLTVYHQFGFRNTGLRYQHPDFQQEHTVITLSQARVLSGEGIHPKIWTRLYAPVTRVLWQKSQDCAGHE